MTENEAENNKKIKELNNQLEKERENMKNLKEKNENQEKDIQTKEEEIKKINIELEQKCLDIQN